MNWPKKGDSLKTLAIEALKRDPRVEAGKVLLYPNNLKNWDLDRIKTPRFDDLQPNITNIEQVEIAQPRELSRKKKTQLTGGMSIDRVIDVLAHSLTEIHPTLGVPL